MTTWSAAPAVDGVIVSWSGDMIVGLVPQYPPIRVRADVPIEIDVRDGSEQILATIEPDGEHGRRYHLPFSRGPAFDAALAARKEIR